MAIKQTRKGGFALLVAVIFMSVMLAFGLALASLSYKQQVLASSAIQSQYAFYAADAGLECALYEDQELLAFNYPTTTPTAAPSIHCDGTVSTHHPSYAGTNGIAENDATHWTIAERLSLDSNKRCADITVVKLKGSQPGSFNYIFSQGYDVPCATVASPSGARFVARGISVRY